MGGRGEETVREQIRGRGKKRGKEIGREEIRGRE